jgi:transcriptional regulator with XRE-family HTH domain
MPALPCFRMDTKPIPALGPLLRSWRERKNWTLKEMSDRTVIPVSTLSKVERDRSSLTYDKLLQVSQGGRCSYRLLRSGCVEFR